MSSSPDATRVAPPGTYPPPMAVPDDSFLAAPEPTRVAFPEQFEIVRRLGAGGMAEVFLAHRIDRAGARTPVVIKRPLPELAAHPEFLDMFLDEARISSALEHPNIVRIEEVIKQPDNCLMVMELVDGKALSSVMARVERRKLRLELRLAAYIVARAAEGLHYAHARRDGDGKPLQIVHRDVSPQNILVSYTGDVKLIDFGIARALGRVTQTKTGTRKGKTGYMAPEQARGTPVDCRVDVFALGIVLWELMTGRRLFVRPDEYRTMNALLIDPIPLPSRYAAVSPQLEVITMRALAREPLQRFASADDVRAALDSFVTSLGGVRDGELADAMQSLFPQESTLLPPSDEPSVGQEIGPAVISRPTVHVGQGMPRDPGRRRTLALGGGALAAAALGGFLGWLGRRMAGGAPQAVVTSAAGAPAPVVPPLVVRTPPASKPEAPPVESAVRPPAPANPAARKLAAGAPARGARNGRGRRGAAARAPRDGRKTNPF
jgi:eukaryotic-like serine/threonine-protein kinase